MEHDIEMLCMLPGILREDYYIVYVNKIDLADLTRKGFI